MPGSKPPPIVDYEQVFIDSMPTSRPYERQAKAAYIKARKAANRGRHSGGGPGQLSFKDKYKAAIQKGKDYWTGPRSNPNYLAEATAKAKATRDTEFKRIKDNSTPGVRGGAVDYNAREAAKKKYKNAVRNIREVNQDAIKRKKTVAINRTATLAASGKGAAGPAGPDTPRRDAKRKADADAVWLWNATIEENKRIAEEERKNNNKGNGGSGGAAAYVPSNFDLMGQQAMDRINPIYDSLEARNKLLNSQRTTMSNEQQSQFAAESAQRYAQMQQAMGTGYQDEATRGSGELQLQALQNAGLQQDQYSRRMQEMNSMNALDNTNAIAQARAAQGSNIWSSVAESRMAEAAAAAEARSKAAGSGGSGGGALSRSEYGYARELAEADMQTQYMDWVSGQGFDKKTQPRLYEQLQRLRGDGYEGAAPDSLLAGLGAGQDRQRRWLTTASQQYNRRRNLTNDQIMTYADTARQGTGSAYRG